MRRSRPIGRRSSRKRKVRDDGEDDAERAFREDVHRRSKGRCERCGRLSSEIHHRRSRSEAWSRWLPENGLDLCNDCHHGIIHANPAWARRHNLILSRHSTTHPAPITDCPITCLVDHDV